MVVEEHTPIIIMLPPLRGATAAGSETFKKPNAPRPRMGLERGASKNHDVYSDFHGS